MVKHSNKEERVHIVRHIKYLVSMVSRCKDKAKTLSQYKLCGRPALIAVFGSNSAGNVDKNQVICCYYSLPGQRLLS